MAGKYIGLKPLNAASGNGGDGVHVGRADDVTIGGSPDFPGMRNWFASNGNGTARDGSPTDEGGIKAFSDAQNLKIENNWIGQRPNGQAAPDLSYGVDIGPGLVKGNTFASAGARPSNAVRLSGSQGTMTGNVVKGSAGAEGYGESGVLVTGSGNRIGGETLADRNVIGGAGASRPGIHLRGDANDGGADPDGDDNKVLGNWLGLSETDTSVPNGGAGVLVDDDADNNDVGGDSLGSRNKIHNSGGDAIEVEGADTDGTRVLQNRGADNAGLFLDLRPADGPGNGSATTGANGGVQPPTVIAGGTSVRGTATPGARVLIFEKSSPLGGELSPMVTSATADGQGRWQANYNRSDGDLVSVMQVAGRNSSELRQSVVDAVSPQTSITSGPSGTTADSTPTFGLASTEPGSSFRCRVDSGPPTPCSSPRTVGPLSEGAHSFSVVATDSAGNTDASAATRTFSVSGTGSSSGPAASGNALKGTAANDVINGTPGDDVIECGAGDDVVNGGGGNDVIRCGAGNDVVDGGTGNDRVLGESGNDRVRGGTGRDRLSGGSGRDRVSGGSGNDRAAGDSGNDRVAGDSGNDRLSGGRGNDRLNGGRGRDRLAGDVGNDRIAGDSGNDRLSGGRGNDRLVGGRGRDRLNGGPGRDRQRQ